MRRGQTLATWPKGLCTDVLDGQGLLQADDVIPLANKSGYRTRGGKYVLSAEASALTGQSFAFPVPSATLGTSGLFVIRRTTVGPYTPCWWDGGATATYFAMPAQANDNAGAALAFSGRNNRYDAYNRYAFANFDQQLFVLPASGIGCRWAGVSPGQASVPTAEYATGTVSTTAGSATITGAGTSWTTTTNMAVGQYIWINNAGLNQRAYRILSINSATSITVDRQLPATTAAQTYRVTFLTWWSVKAGTFGAQTLAATAPLASSSSVAAACCSQHAGRVFVGDTTEYVVNGTSNRRMFERLRWCSTASETDALFSGTGEWGGAEYFHPNAYLDIDTGNGGGRILGLASFGGSLFIFKSGAVYILRGDVETDGRDVGASVDTIIRNDGLFAGSSPVVTPFGVVFAGSRGVYLVTPTGVTNLTDKAGIRDFYTTTYVAPWNQQLGGSPWALSWTGSRLVLQGTNRTQNQAATAGIPNTLVWYPQDDVWVTQTTLLCGPIYQGAYTGSLVGQNEVAISEDVSNAQMILWGADSDFAITVGQRVETPLMKILTHPMKLPGGMNARVRAMLVKAKIVDPGGTTPNIYMQTLLGEQYSNVVGAAVEPAITALGPRQAVSSQTEKWSRLPIRVGTPPVDMVRFLIRQAGASLDCRVYQAGVEYVSVSRQR